MTSLRRFAWSWLIALGALPFGQSIAHAEARVPTHVACVGDSITAGAGASVPAKNYPSVLQTLFGAQVQVKNFGHSGATMLSKTYGDLPYQDQTEYQGATDFVKGAGANAVVDVIIMLGTNDSKPFNWAPTGKPKNDQQYLKDYRAMVEHFTALTPKPVVYLALPLATGTSPCCSISGTVIHDEVLPLIKQLAIEEKLPTIDLNTPTTGHNEYFGDGVHPNDATYALVAQLTHDGLLRVPTVSLTGLMNGDARPATTLALTADASGGTVAIDSVEFFNGATSLGKATVAPFGVFWPATPGNYTLSAKAIDSTQASAASMPIAVSIVPNVIDSGGAGGASSGGSAGSAGAGAAAGGAPPASAGAAGSGVAGAAGSGVVNPRLLPPSDSDGCAVARGNRAGSALSAAALLGLALLGARRRRVRATMC